MKQTYTFCPSIIVSHAVKTNAAAFDLSIEAFENRDYRTSLHTLLDFIDKDIRSKYGNKAGDEFHIPHGPLFLYLKQDCKEVSISAPFLILPESNSIAMMRQATNLNFDNLDLARLALRDNRLYFEYNCPLSKSHPSKIYHALKEICKTGAKYDYEFQDSFSARRIREPQFIPYAPETVNYIYEGVQQSCRECLEALSYFEPSRKFNDMWTVITTTLLKVMYLAQPQGKLRVILQKAIRDMDRDISLAEKVSAGKQVILELQEIAPDEWPSYLYYTETFISGKQRSNLQSIRESYEKCYKQVSASIESEDYRSVCLKIMHKFYETYYDNDLIPEELDTILSRALAQASAQPWSTAAPILYQVLEKIIQSPVRSSQTSRQIAA